MAGFVREFISEEPRSFRWRIGKALASSLSGFIFGAIFASTIWAVGLYFYKLFNQ